MIHDIFNWFKIEMDENINSTWFKAKTLNFF